MAHSSSKRSSRFRGSLGSEETVLGENSKLTGLLQRRLSLANRQIAELKKQTPLSTAEDIQLAGQKARDEEEKRRKELRSRFGRSGTIKTGPTGLPGEASLLFESLT